MLGTSGYVSQTQFSVMGNLLLGSNGDTKYSVYGGLWEPILLLLLPWVTHVKYILQTSAVFIYYSQSLTQFYCRLLCLNNYTTHFTYCYDFNITPIVICCLKNTKPQVVSHPPRKKKQDKNYP